MMEWAMRRPRLDLCRTAVRHDTTYLHRRLQATPPLELHAHVSRVACCTVITGTRPQELCIISGDAVGNLSIFYLSIPDVCFQTEANSDEDTAQRRRIRPNVRFRGAHRGSINCMHHIERTSLVLTGGDDGAVRLWNVREDLIVESKLQCVQEFLFHSSCVLACDVDASQTFMTTTGLDGVVAVWLLGAPIPLLTVAVGEPCYDVSILRTDPSLIQVTLRDRVSVWDLRTQPHYLHFQRALTAHVRKRVEHYPPDQLNAPLHQLQRVFVEENPLSWIRGFNHTEMCLLSLHTRKSPAFKVAAPRYDEETRRYVSPFEGHDASAQLLRARPMYEGRTILTYASDHAHKLWNAQTRKGIASFELPTQSRHATTEETTTDLLVAAGLLCHQQRFLYGADTTGQVFVWDVQNAITSLERSGDAVVLPVWCLHGHVFFVASIALSHDDTVLVTGDASGKLHVRIAM